MHIKYFNKHGYSQPILHLLSLLKPLITPSSSPFWFTHLFTSTSKNPSSQTLHIFACLLFTSIERTVQFDRFPSSFPSQTHPNCLKADAVDRSLKRRWQVLIYSEDSKQGKSIYINLLKKKIKEFRKYAFTSLTGRLKHPKMPHCWKSPVTGHINISTVIVPLYLEQL